ncbi:sulfurtransferase [Tsukamurella sp. 8F]|uniref:sulfurtransferase n=1 Tax=unclassified Tsukamurella TaxID=2633480 RepID=UPI0023BA1FBE|nr:MULTISPECIES: sulfurtransferase [unclassified Tsukamurella]MDF0531654.1 sulfurtransferase [Tsukamurella sp. 8J]MDF0588778.1 sulfurtransferase [Tsukamurella sp. 8F]
MSVLATVPDVDSLTAPVLLDVRWRLGRSDGREQYLAGHIPGAVFVDLEAELAAPPSAGEGRHPLPDIADLQAAARRWGVHAGDAVVAYDDNAGQAAARAWWLLRWAGVADVRILDGGLAAWRTAGLPLATGEETTEQGDVVLAAGHLATVGIDDVADVPVLLDARAAERYRGEVEPVDPRAGHIPGARSAPTASNLLPDSRFRPASELREHYAGLGAVPGADVAVYCGSGVTAAHDIAALAIAGVDAALFPGSWSQWCGDPARPAATGA